MKLKSILTFGICALIFTACGSENSSSSSANPSVDPLGNCSASFVADYNSVYFATSNLDMRSRMFSRTSSEMEQEFTRVENACQTFFNNHDASVACHAQVAYVPKKISSQDVKTACDKAAAAKASNN